MKKIFTALLVISVQIINGQDCETRAANQPSESTRFQDSYDRSYEDAKANISTTKMKPQLTIAENWIKGILKNFTGAKLVYSNAYFFNYTNGYTNGFYKTTGIKGYYEAKMRFYAYYCYESRDKIFTEEESGSHAVVTFNDVFNSPLCTSVGLFTINGKPAFKMFEKNRTEGRVDFYEQIGMSNDFDTVYRSKHDLILIRNSDQPVFVAISRREYLQFLLKDVEDAKKKQIDFAKLSYTPATEAANKAQFDEQLKRIDNSKQYTSEQMASYRKRFIETWQTEKQKFDKQVARLETDAAETRQVLEDYLKKPQEWLDRNFKDFYTYGIYSGRGMKEYLEKLDVSRLPAEEESRTYVASLNPAYFNKSLSADAPQLILVHLRKGSYAHMKKVAGLVLKPGALKPLEAILAPGKKVVVQPLIASAPAYRVSYLPKLNTLTPLTVPADMKPSAVPVIPVNNPSAAKLNFEIPVLSAKLKQLPAQPLTTESYKAYVQDLQTAISNTVKPPVKKKSDDYLAAKKLTQSKDIGDAAFAAWLQNSPEASLYLYGKAVANNPSDVLTANNFSAFMIMSGLPEKSIPILEFWNKQKPGESILLANLGNAYYKLGDVTNAMKYLQQCVQKDSLHPTANKLLCMMYLKKGDIKKAEEHGTRSITTSHDEEVIAILRQINNKVKVGDIMSRFPPLPVKEFPMLQRIKLPLVPSVLDDMAPFAVELEAMKQSLKMTIEAIETKHSNVSDDMQQKLLMASFKNGSSPIRVKAQHIVMDGMQTYQAERAKEADVFNHNYKKLTAPHNVKLRAIQKNYNDQLNKLEGGEAGDEDKIQALELAKCNEWNAAMQAYLPQLATLVNQYAQRQEYISRKFFRDYANWAPYWLPETSNSFPSIQVSYLEDVLNILSNYKLVSKSNCEPVEPLPGKEGRLQEWEDEYCANFKGKIEVGFGKISWTCNSVGLEGGEGFVGGLEVNFSDKGEFEDFTIEGGIGATMHLGANKLIKVEGGATAKEFLKIGPDKTTGKWAVKDFGVKGEISIEGEIGKFSSEVKLIESSIAVNAGVNVSGVIAPLLPLK